MPNLSLFMRLLLRLKHSLSDRTYTMLVASLVGICAGFAAVMLRVAVHMTSHELVSTQLIPPWFKLAYPGVGLLLTAMLAGWIYREKTLGHAIGDLLYRISHKAGRVGSDKIYSRWMTSILTVGFGGSCGLESPILMTGGAIGSNIGGRFSMTAQQRTLMIGCGTAGALAGIFNAPVAGLIFSIEVILARVSLDNIVPLLISSVSATLLSSLLIGNDILFFFQITEAVAFREMPMFMLLGMVCGATAIYFNNTFHYLEGYFERLKMNRYLRAICAGALLSAIVLVFPATFGEGYNSVLDLLKGRPDTMVAASPIASWLVPDLTGWAFLVYLVALVLVKGLATSVTLGSGGSGGTFGPSLVLGGLTGFAFAHLLNLLGVEGVSAQHCTLVGMCGMMSGIQYAPLTAVFLIAELTGSYALFVPLMLVSAIAHLTTAYFQPDSPPVRYLKEHGGFDDRDDDTRVLDRLNINQLVETDFKAVPLEGTMTDLVEAISHSRRNVFPVIDTEGKLMGIINLDSVREIMFDHDKQRTPLRTLYTKPKLLVKQGERMREVMRMFEHTGYWSLPVVDSTGVYLGFVSKSRIFEVYRKQLMRKRAQR